MIAHSKTAKEESEQQQSSTAVEDALQSWLGLSFPSSLTAIKEADFTPDDIDAYCQRCGESVGKGEASQSGCSSCRGKPKIASHIIRLGRYNKSLRDWIQYAKYHTWNEIAFTLGELLGKELVKQNLNNKDNTIIVPIPMPWQRRMYRGIDHARVIADGVSKTTHLPVFNILKKRNSLPQTMLSATERRKGRKDWIKPRKRIGGWPLDKYTVILVDDVKTTGTTIKTCTRILKSLNAKKVVAAVLAVTDPPTRRDTNVKTSKTQNIEIKELKKGEKKEMSKSVEIEVKCEQSSIK